MAVLVVPTLEEQPWPTLGGQVCDFIESLLVFGPGDLRGLPAKLDAEKRALIYRMYEVFPQGHPQEGRRRFKRVAISLRKGSAKALALDTPLPTLEGWKVMGEIQPGDVLFDEQGQQCRVLAVSEIFEGHKCYAVKFRDGSEIIADAGHLWYTEELRNRPYIGSVKTTADLAASVSPRPDGARNHRIPVTRPLYISETALPIDPWILGAWLGDGRSDDAEFTMAEQDHAHFCERVEQAGYFTTTPKKDTRNPRTWAVRVSVNPIGKANHNGKSTLKGELRNLGVLDNKHIPDVYQRSGFQQRLALLQGLMDTDGTTDSGKNGYCAFTSTLLVLAEGVYELAAGLGLKPSLRVSKTSLHGAKHVSPAWRVSFQAYSDMPVFSLPRKRAILRVKPKCTPMSTNRHIVAVDEVPSVPTRCIAVDSPSHLYLAGRAMIPTHNTELAAWIAAAELHPEGPVRCIGFDGHGRPVGGGVTDPYIPMVAYTEEQSDELAYGALRMILQYSQVARDFDIGLERIMRAGGDGKAVSLATAPDARDGARTTMQVFDEPLALDTLVPTPDGWTTIGAIQPGDKVFGRDGKAINVIGVSPVHTERPCYRVLFGDGSEVITDGAHRWRMYDHSQSYCCERTVTTEEMYKKNWKHARRFVLPESEPLQLPEAELPIHPYVLGLWLGDGDARNATLSVGCEDLEAVESELASLGYTARRCVTGDRAPLLYIGDAENGYGKTVRSRLRKLGLHANKHIPAVYLRASIGQRLSLLQGLMDSDGHIGKGGYCTFVNTNLRLICDTEELLLTLGYRPHHIQTIDGRWQRPITMHKLHFASRPNLPPFRMARKLFRVSTAQPKITTGRSVRLVEPVPSVPVRCIAVDSADHLFLVGDGMVPTHNTHRFTLPRLKMAHRTMLANIPKRKLSDAWSFEITTAPAPGEGSVAEDTMDYARQVADGKIADAKLFFFHRQAHDGYDLEDPEQVRQAIIEASGPVAEWSDIEGIAEQWRDPTADRTYLERVWLNRVVRSSDRAFDAEQWKALVAPETVIPDGATITLGFDGARYRDATALVATHIESGYQWLVGLWEHPHGVDGWEVPVAEVEALLAEAFRRWEVWRLYADPPYWETTIAKWAGEYGTERVFEWWTNRPKAMAYAIKSYTNAIMSAELSHDGSAGLARHIGNACRRVLAIRDEEDKPLWVMQKERPDSPHKIDAAMAGCLSWEARCDALASGVGGPSVYEERGLLWV